MEAQGTREVSALRIDPLAEPVGDRGIVGGGALIDLQRQAEVGCTGDVTVIGVHFIDDLSIISRVDDDRDRLVVLGGAAQHGRAANVDILDGVVEGAVGVGHGCLEGIEIDHDHVDRRDVMLCHFGDVGRVIAQTEQAAVNFRVQGLDATIEHFRVAGVFGDILYLKPGLPQHARGASRGEDFNPESAQSLGKRNDAGFVGNTD